MSADFAKPLALTLALTLCGCGATPPKADSANDELHVPWDGQKPAAEPSGTTREVSARELSVVQELVRAAERVRGLRFRQKVPVLVQDAEAIMAYVDSQIDDAELAQAQVVYAALGLLSPNVDVRALLLRLMGEQVVGYYDVDAHQLVIRDDVMRAFGGEGDVSGVNVDEARVVLVHELVHALQDQHLQLSVSMNSKRDTDAENAFRALVEGAASLTQITSDPAAVRTLSALVRSSPLAGSELESAPEIVRAPLLSAYVDGLGFAAHLHGAGGFARLDRAHVDPPASTEQVLHPERFAARDQPLVLRVKAAATLLGEGFELFYEDTLGELELSVYLGQASRPEPAAHAAQGWGGDRLYAYRDRAGQTAIVWLQGWDDVTEAAEAEKSAVQVMGAASGEARAAQRVERCGRAVLVLRAVPPALHPLVRAAFARTAIDAGLATAADCKPAGN